jgi:hypothetical protein
MNLRETTEEKIVKVIDEFIVYMLTENDAEQIIYSKLNELDGDELDDWINDELKDYLGNGCCCEDIDPEEINCWYKGNLGEIFTNTGDLMKIQRDIYNFYINEFGRFPEDKFENLFWNGDLLALYTFKYFYEFDSDDLKEHIINLIDPPFEPK